LVQIKKDYERTNPGSSFVDYMKGIFDEIITNFDQTKVKEFAADFQAVKEKFMELDPQAKIVSYLQGI